MPGENVHAWRYFGQERPAFALEPDQGQESVWDYPRPPRIERESREVIVRVGEVVIAQTHQACRVLETASPPTFYIPRTDIKDEYLCRAGGFSLCEWKGTARYWTVSVPPVVLESVGWSYDNPHPEFESIRGWLSFYPARIESMSTDQGDAAAGGSRAAGSHRTSLVPSRVLPGQADGSWAQTRVAAPALVNQGRHPLHAVRLDRVLAGEND